LGSTEKVILDMVRKGFNIPSHGKFPLRGVQWGWLGGRGLVGGNTPLPPTFLPL